MHRQPSLSTFTHNFRLACVSSEEQETAAFKLPELETPRAARRESPVFRAFGRSAERMGSAAFHLVRIALRNPHAGSLYHPPNTSGRARAWPILCACLWRKGWDTDRVPSALIFLRRDLRMVVTFFGISLPPFRQKRETMGSQRVQVLGSGSDDRDLRRVFLVRLL